MKITKWFLFKTLIGCFIGITYLIIESFIEKNTPGLIALTIIFLTIIASI